MTKNAKEPLEPRAQNISARCGCYSLSVRHKEIDLLNASRCEYLQLLLPFRRLGRAFSSARKGNLERALAAVTGSGGPEAEAMKMALLRLPSRRAVRARYSRLSGRGDGGGGLPTQAAVVLNN